MGTRRKDWLKSNKHINNILTRLIESVVFFICIKIFLAELLIEIWSDASQMGLSVSKIVEKQI